MILDVVYNHTAEGNHLGPMLSLQGRRQQVLLPPRRPTTSASTWTSRAPATRSTPCHPSDPAADHGLAALLGHRVPRRRLPLRPRLAPSPASSTTSTASRRSSTRSTRTPSCRRSSSSPSRGTSAPAATRSATSPCCGRSGTGSTATSCATSGAARPALGDFAARLAGSSDLYEPDGRNPFASINFITAHDGFTLADLVSYNDKHNEANQRGQPRRDRRQPLLELRRRGPDRRPGDQRRCAPASSATSSRRCMLSQGVPMLLGGDEFCRTQNGNNNAWCQDNEISWYDWDARGGGAATCSPSRGGSSPCASVTRSSAARHFLERRGLGGVRAARRVVVPPRRAADDAARLGAPRPAPRRPVPQRRGVPVPRRRAASASRTTRSCCCSTPTTRTSSSRCPARATAPAGTLELSSAEPEADQGAWNVPARGTVQVIARSVVVLKHAG